MKEKVEEKLRKKRSPGFKKRFKKYFKKVWVGFIFFILLDNDTYFDIKKNVVKNPIKKINRELIERPIKKLKCARLVRKTIGFKMVSTGVVKLGISLRLDNTSFTDAEGGMILSFVPTFHILGQVQSWNLDQVSTRSLTATSIT